MLDIKYIEQNYNKVVSKLINRGLRTSAGFIEELLMANDLRKSSQKKSDTLASELNQKSKALAALLKTNPEAAEAEKKKLLALKEQQKSQLEVLKYAEEKINRMILEIPNLPYDEVPVGDATANEVVKSVEAPANSQAPTHLKPHWELTEAYKLIDFEKGSKIAGTGFPVYIGKGARLQRALVNFFLDQALEAGYQEVQPPLLVNEASAFGTGQLPDKEGMMYELSNSPMYLIPTAEVPVTNLYRDTLLRAEELPIRHVAYTPCFRREAGSAGTQVRGLNRLHQFDKVELVEIHTPQTSKKALAEMVNYVAGLLDQLELSYRILKLASEDLGFTAAITYDFEVWSTGQKKWLEVSSVSCFDTYQARRMHLRYKENKKNSHCHTLNGSGLALPRIMAALLEKNQTASGIHIPSSLVPYTQWDTILERSL